MIAVDDDGSTNPEATSHNSNERNSVDLRVVIIVLSIFAFYQSESKREMWLDMSCACGEFVSLIGCWLNVEFLLAAKRYLSITQTGE